MVSLLFFCFGVGAIATALVVRWGNAHAQGYDLDKPQRFHAGHVSRLGGIGMAIALAAGLVIDSLYGGMVRRAGAPLDLLDTLKWCLVLAPAFLGGAYEDVTQRLAVKVRLGLTLSSALLGVWLLDLAVPRLDIQVLDTLWTATPWLAIALAIFAVTGLPHAFNMIDGYNGLAGAVAIFICLAIAYVALQAGDRQIAAVMMCMAGATAGFLLWNYPRGMIFAGDGGAYLWGAVIATGSVLLVQRHAAVSPWFPVLLLIYPLSEAFFSIYRKLARGQSPGVADALHFHQLIYKRVVPRAIHGDAARRLLMRNNRTSPYLWTFTLSTVLPAMLLWRHTWALMALSLIFAIAYIWAYIGIVRFKVPLWMRL